MMKVLHLTRQRKDSGRFFYTRALCVMIAALGLSVNAAAQEEYVEMELEELLNVQVEVATTAKAQDVFSTTSTVSIIDKRTIEKYGFQSVSEALQIVPGFNVVRTYIKRNLPTSRGVLQDHYANKVLVLINGVPSFHAVTGEGNLDRVSIHDVERIEVLKGPGSVVYGSNAFTGAVNLVLKKTAEFDEVDIQGEAKLGTEDLIEGSARYVSEDEESRLFISGMGRKERGRETSFTDEGGTVGELNEGIERAGMTVHGTMGDHSLLVNAYNVDESYYGITPNFSAGAGNDHEVKGYLANYAFTPQISETMGLELSGTFDWNQRVAPRTFDDNTVADIVGWRAAGAGRLNMALDEAMTLALGGDYEIRKSEYYENILVIEDEVLSDNNMDGQDVYEFAFFGEFGYDAEPINALAGIRFTENQLFGSNFSARGTLVYKLNPTNSIKFIIAQAYRSPSLFEFYFETSALTVQGNTDLDPETSVSYELAYVSAFENLFLQILAYYAEYEDKVFRRAFIQPDGSSTNKYFNGDKFDAWGGEIEARYLNPQLIDMFVNYSIVEGSDGDEFQGNDNYNFKYVPQSTLAVGLSKEMSGVFASLVFNYQTDAEGPVGDVDDGWVFDAQLGYRQELENGVKLRHAVIATNLFDEELEYAEYVRRRTVNDLPSGYGRRIIYQVSFAF